MIDGADNLSVWIEPKDMVNEDFLISQVDSYSAKLIKINKTKVTDAIILSCFERFKS